MGGEPVEFGINFTAGLTFLLICSSVTMVMAYAAIVEHNRKSAVKWLLLTALGGGLFLCGQMQEYFGAFEFLFPVASSVRRRSLRACAAPIYYSSHIRAQASCTKAR